MKMRKLLAISLALCLALSLLAGCAPSEGGGDDPGTPSGGDPGTTTKDITLNVALNMDIQEAFEAFMRDFEDKNPGVKIDITPLGVEIAEYLQTCLASHSMPDAFSINADTFGKKLADDGEMIDLRGSEAEKLMIDAAIAPFTSSTGVYYGLPYGLTTALIYYNKDIFEACGITEIPADWDAFLALCEKLKQAGYVPLSMALGDGTAGNTLWSFGFANNVGLYDPDWQDKVADGSFDFNQEGVVDIFEKSKLLVDKGYAQDGVVSAQYQASIDVFAQGGTAMYFGGAWNCGAIKSAASFEFGVFNPPMNAPGKEQAVVLSPETGWGGSSKSAHIEEVTALLNHFAGEGGLILQNARQSIPATKDTAGTVVDPAIMEILPSLTSAKVAFPLYFSYLPTIFQTDIPKLFQEAVLGTSTPAETAVLFQETYAANVGK